jgi:phosphoglycerate kinase
MSHLGRPDGAKNPNESLKHVLPTLEKLLGAKVTFLPDCVGPENAEVLRAPAPGSVFLLENLRFYLEEEKSVTDKAGKKTKADEKAVER